MVAGLLNKNVFFRCDGGSDLGLGHITRSIELALGFKKLGLKYMGVIHAKHTQSTIKLFGLWS